MGRVHLREFRRLYGEWVESEPSKTNMSSVMPSRISAAESEAKRRVLKGDERVIPARLSV